MQYQGITLNKCFGQTPPPPPPVLFECFPNRQEMTLFFTMGYPHNLQIELCSLRSKGKKEVLTMTTATPRTTPSKKSLIFYPRMSQLVGSVQNVCSWLVCNGQRPIPKGDTSNQPLRYTFSKIRSTLSFYVAVLQRIGRQNNAQRIKTHVENHCFVHQTYSF